MGWDIGVLMVIEWLAAQTSTRSLVRIWVRRGFGRVRRVGG